MHQNILPGLRCYSWLGLPALMAAQAQQVAVYFIELGAFSKVELLGIGLVGLLEVVLPSVGFITSVVVFRRLWRRDQILALLAWICPLGASARTSGIRGWIDTLGCLVCQCGGSQISQELDSDLNSLLMRGKFFRSGNSY